MQVISDWFKRYFSDPQVTILAVLLLGGFLVVIYFGNMLAPVLAALVIAFLLDGLVSLMEEHGAPRWMAVWLVFMVFMVLLLIILFGIVPLLSQQITQLVQELPNMVGLGQKALLRLPERYPDFFSEEQIREMISTIRSQVAVGGQSLVAFSLASIPNIVTLVVYLVLLPFLVFFFLKDKDLIMGWGAGYLPAERRLVNKVWHEVNDQLSNYVRGKFWEILIVGVISYVVFAFMGLQYAVLLGAMVGLSVIIPYIGAAVVTFPIAIIGYFQWGWGSDFLYLMIAYAVIQALDGNVLVPLLFSEAVNLHPIAIIVAVLLFGGLWGFWGVFFAIPLATLVKAVLTAWPRAAAPPAEAPAEAEQESGEEQG